MASDPAGHCPDQDWAHDRSWALDRDRALDHDRAFDHDRALDHDWALAFGWARATLAGLPLAMDGIARNAAALAAAPIGSVTLTDAAADHLIGLHGELGLTTARRTLTEPDSLFRRVWATGVPLILSNVGSVPGPECTPDAIAPGVRAFAGVPLLGAGGRVVGAVCALDTHPRPWTGEHIGALAGLASAVGLLPGVTEAEVPIAPGVLDTIAVASTDPEAFIAVDPSGAVVAWNTAASVAFEWSTQDVLGRSLREALFPGGLPPQLRDALHALRHSSVAGTVPTQRWLLRASTRRGRALPVEVTISAMPAVEETLLCLALRDVSGQVTAPAEALGRSTLLAATLEDLPSSVYACDTTGRTLVANGALRRMVGRTAATLWETNRIVRDFLASPDGRRLAPTEYPSARALAGERLGALELHLAVRGRPRRPLLVDADRITVNGITVGAVVLLRDLVETVRRPATGTLRTRPRRSGD